MKTFSATLLLLACCAPAFADTDAVPHVSPDGRHAVHNVGDTAQAEHYFEIRTKAGEVLMSGKNYRDSHASDILWSADSAFVLFRYQDGRLDSTALYSFAERKFIDLSHVSDGWTVPIRWVSRRTFVVEDSGPHGGKAEPGGYHYRKTYRIRPQPLRLECVYTSPTIQEPE